MKKTILLISILSLLFVSCKFDASSQYTYRPPENINDGFDVGSLDEVNIDSVLIVEAVNKIHQGIYKEIHSMLIYKEKNYTGNLKKYIEFISSSAAKKVIVEAGGLPVD